MPDTSDSLTLDEHAQSTYGELRTVAGRLLRIPHLYTFSPTGLVHEAFVKLARSKQAKWKDQRHFVSACAQAMRHLLIDRARKKMTALHGGQRERVPLSDALLGNLRCERLVALSEALQLLKTVDRRQAEIVQLRFFAGLTNQEVAELLGTSKRTVQSDWRTARAWLHRELDDETTTSEKAAPAVKKAVLESP